MTLGAIMSEFDEAGFVVIPRPVRDLRAAYDRAVASAAPEDVSRSSSTRVHDFVGRGPDFDCLWQDSVLLAIAERAFTRPFKLSSFHARAVNSGGGPQAMHVDCARDNGSLALLGFIWMIDEFTVENGATRLIPCGREEPIVAIGKPGTVIVYDGAILHEFGLNRTDEPRRSIQGAFVLRTMTSAINWRARLKPDTTTRLDARARYLLDIE